MDYPIIAIVHINFRRREFLASDCRAIESILRVGQVYHLVVGKSAITFYIWGQKRVNYGILKKIKAALLSKEYPNFVITADEYVKTGQKFYYDSKPDRLSFRPSAQI